jgi:hypothetical protein
MAGSLGLRDRALGLLPLPLLARPRLLLPAAPTPTRPALLSNSLPPRLPR